MLKKILFLILLSYTPDVFANSSQYVRLVYSTANITLGTYQTLILSTAQIIRNVSVFDSGGQTMVYALGNPGHEVPQLVIPPGGGDFPVGIGKGVRVSIKALSSTANTGEHDANFMY